MTNTPILYWVRDDLRIQDNPALFHACQSGKPVFALYVLEDVYGIRAAGGAAKWWLHHALKDFAASLDKLNIPLILRVGDSKTIVLDVVEKSGAKSVVWNRRYEPGSVEHDKDIKETLKVGNIAVTSFKANLLFEPWEVKNGSGGNYKVFSPFWKAALKLGDIADVVGTPEALKAQTSATLDTDDLNDWKLLPTKPNWAKQFEKMWSPTEQGAHDRLEDFLEGQVQSYKTKRDFPAERVCSELSAYLRFGQISPKQIWHNVYRHAAGSPSASDNKFLSEVGWREFAFSLLFYSEDLANRNLRPEFNAFPWKEDPSALTAWQKGQTGYPFVDAGMRELWATGRMHNRVRMVVASFLIKDLLIDWREGEKWFWDTLVDADVANNPFGWQWVAGCGADAAPFFRIFNPITQGTKFDPDGIYVRKWVPELKKLDNKYIHSPWEAPKDELKRAGVELGKTYPKPIVDHAKARDIALKAFKEITGADEE